MQNQTSTMERSGMGQGASPVDNNTYNLLQTLTSKLEAIEVYTKYLNDADGETRQFFESCRDSDRQSAEQCLQLLRQRLGGS
jgi:hypothetical protein